MGARAFSRFWTVVLALCGALFVLRALRLLARWVLSRRVVANVRLDAQGLQLIQQTTLLGRQVHERQILIPLSNLSRVERVARFARSGFYAGLIALALGSFIGIQLMIEGLRGAPAAVELVLWGTGVMALGVILDFGLVSLWGEARAQCRLRIVTLDGARLEVSSLDPPLVDALLAALKVHWSEQAWEWRSEARQVPPPAPANPAAPQVG